MASKYDYRDDLLATWEKLLGMLLYFHPGRRTDTDFSVMCLPETPNGRLLDVGCGSGAMLKFLQELGWDVEGVDFDPGGVQNARRKGLRVHLGTLEAQHYPDNFVNVRNVEKIIYFILNRFNLEFQDHTLSAFTQAA